jgi:glycosyltransferase involved in cell wall biosynthesis
MEKTLNKFGFEAGHERSGIELSLLVPIYDEGTVIDTFFETMEPVLEKLDMSYEIVCVDDGSNDDSLEKLKRHRDRNANIKIIELSRNFGKEYALTAALEYCVGNAVIPIDVDLQDPPELIPEFIDKWRQGFNIVHGVRADRRSDSLLKRGTANMFYKMYNHLANVHLPPDAGDYKLMDRCVVDAIRQLPERNRFMKGIVNWVGFKQTSIDYVRKKRAGGQTKWNYWKLWNFALDGITSFSTVPLRIWTYIGAVISLSSFAYASYLVFRVFRFGIELPGYMSMMVVILFLGGIQIMTLGVIGEYIGRLYQESKNRPMYIVRNTFGTGSE